MMITKTAYFSKTVIMVGEVQHLIFDRRKVAAVDSWYDDGCYFIRITFDQGAAVELEYDSKEKWATVLRLIQEALVK